MPVYKYIAMSGLPGWLGELAGSFTVYTPQETGAAVVYREYAAGSTPVLDKRPTESAKHVIFPRSETLFTYSYAADPEVAGRKNLTLKEPEAPKPALVFGGPSCDARGFFAFDHVYDGSGTKGLAQDNYYIQRRTQTAFVVLACKSMLSSCFCHWSEGAPVCREGVDVLAFALDDGLLLEGVTEKGQALLQSNLLQEASPEQLEAAKAAEKVALEQMPPAPENLGESTSALLSLFDNLDFWRAQSAGCISCGACTYLCPACYCFNITDEGTGQSGIRLRSWDNCMAPLFTLEASGHNPRTAKAMRLRNRVGHKFSYYPKLHQGHFSCSGCGRCIKSCPSSVDIRSIVQNAIAAAKEKA